MNDASWPRDPAGTPSADEQTQTFDDDALADAMAAEVAPYTSPISVIPGLPFEPPSAPSPQLPPEPPVSEPVTYEPVTPEPVIPEPVTYEPVIPEPVTPEPAPVEPVTFEPATREPESELESSVSTLEAIELLQARLREQGPVAAPVPPAPAPPAPVDPGPPAAPGAASPPFYPPPPVFVPDPVTEIELPLFRQPDSEPPDFEPPEPDRHEGEDEPSHPFNGGAERNWPPAYGDVPPLLIVPPPSLVQPPPPAQPLTPPSPLESLPTLAPPSVADVVDLPPPAGFTRDAPVAEVKESTDPDPAPAPDVDEDDDAIDPIDRVSLADLAESTAGAFAAASVAESVPVPPYPEAVSASPGSPFDEHAIPDSTDAADAHVGTPALTVEGAGLEPTPGEARTGRAVRMFWLWFAANSSIVSIAIGAVIFSLGMSLRQAIVATLAGVALSFLPLGLGTLAGKRSGQPTMVLSRASFGHLGNLLPAIVAILSRLFWAALLVWVLADSVARVLVEAGLDAGWGVSGLSLIAAAISGLLVAGVAAFGYGLIVRVQMVLSIVSGLLMVGVIVITAPQVDLSAALLVGDGSWLLVITGAVLVFSVIGIAWVHSSADVARYQRPSGSGGASMLAATFGATLPPFALIVWGAVLAASSPRLARGLASEPLATLASLLPVWYPAPLIAAAVLGLLSGAVLAVYSGGFALQAVGVRLQRLPVTLIVAVVAVAAAVGLVLSSADLGTIVRDIATTLAVPIAAWVGIFAAEVMLRMHAYSAAALLRPGGVYPKVRAINLSSFLALTVIGWGLISASFPGLEWEGYLFRLLGVGADDPLAGTDIGVIVALVGALVFTLATARPAIRRQEGRRVGLS